MSTLCEPLESAETGLAVLVGAAQGGDREAFGELFSRYERSVYSVAVRRLGQHAEAQELVQEVFIQALRKLEQLREPAAFGGWLRSITVRLAINRQVRGSHVAAVDPSTLEATCGEDHNPFDQAVSRERREQVRTVLGQLGRLDRETLVAFYLKGRTLVEMSDEFAAPIGTIKRRLHVARKRFAEAFGSEEYSDEPTGVEDEAILAV